LRHRLVEGFRGHLDSVLGAGEDATGDQAGTERHGMKGSRIRVLFAIWQSASLSPDDGAMH
jgi:hypothetical protein